MTYTQPLSAEFTKTPYESDTPETEHALHGVWYRGDHGSAISDLCRKLERERNQLREAIKETIQDNSHLQKRTVGSSAWLCRFGWHRWTRWATDAEITVTSYPYGVATENLKGLSKPATRQRRECSCCGKLQYYVAKTQTA